MQAARRAMSALRSMQQQTRSMSVGPVKQLSAAENEKELRYHTLTVGIGMAIVVATEIYFKLNPEQHDDSIIPYYPYMRIRNRPFPWGDDGLFEIHRHVAPKPE